VEDGTAVGLVVVGTVGNEVGDVVGVEEYTPEGDIVVGLLGEAPGKH
jgi:uncharacterized protein YcfJ